MALFEDCTTETTALQRLLHCCWLRSAMRLLHNWAEDYTAGDCTEAAALEKCTAGLRLERGCTAGLMMAQLGRGCTAGLRLEKEHLAAGLRMALLD